MIINFDVGTQLGLGSAEPQQIFLNVIQLLLGFMPLLATLMIVLGGFQWLTSGGNEERVDQAKRTLSGAVVGMTITIFAWALVKFVLTTTINISTNG
jgi:hypothetical protein